MRSCVTAECSPWTNRKSTTSIVLGHAGLRSSTTRVNIGQEPRSRLVAQGDSGAQFVYRQQRSTSRLLILWSETTHFVATTTWLPESSVGDATTIRILTRRTSDRYEALPSSACMREKVCLAETLHFPCTKMQQKLRKVGTFASKVRVAWGMFRNRTR